VILESYQRSSPGDPRGTSVPPREEGRDIQRKEERAEIPGDIRGRRAREGRRIRKSGDEEEEGDRKSKKEGGRR
jgi:hypothetical protein